MEGKGKSKRKKKEQNTKTVEEGCSLPTRKMAWGLSNILWVGVTSLVPTSKHCSFKKQLLLDYVISQSFVCWVGAVCCLEGMLVLCFFRNDRSIEQQLMTHWLQAPPARNVCLVWLGLHSASPWRIVHSIAFRWVKLQSAILRHCAGLSQHDNIVKHSYSAPCAFECGCRGSWGLEAFCHHKGTKARSLWIRARFMNFKSKGMFASKAVGEPVGLMGWQLKKEEDIWHWSIAQQPDLRCWRQETRKIKLTFLG